VDEQTTDDSVDISITDEVDGHLDLVARSTNLRGSGYIEQDNL
jgi:hypothetical protein